MGELTVGQVLDFFAQTQAKPMIDWHNQSGGPECYICVDDYPLAEVFRDHFGIKFLVSEEIQDRRDEDTVRAGRS